jgi:hypothetical protein
MSGYEQSLEANNTTLKVLIDELEEECRNVLNLVNTLKAKNLTYDEREDVLGELSSTLCHLKIHSGEVEEMIDNNW